MSSKKVKRDGTDVSGLHAINLTEYYNSCVYYHEGSITGTSEATRRRCMKAAQEYIRPGAPMPDKRQWTKQFNEFY